MTKEFQFLQEEERFIGGGFETSPAEESMVFIWDSEHLVFVL